MEPQRLGVKAYRRDSPCGPVVLTIGSGGSWVRPLPDSLPGEILPVLGHSSGR